MSIQPSNDDETILNNGIQTIIDAFKIQSNKYLTIISSLNQKIQTLQAQNDLLRNENTQYLSELSELRTKLVTISTTANDQNVPKEEVSILYTNPSAYSKPQIKNEISLNNYRNATRTVSNSQSFVTTRTNKTNKSNLSCKSDISKFNSINQRINSLRNINIANHSHYNDTYSNLEDENEDIFNNTNKSYIRNSTLNRERYYSCNKGNENKSKQYQKTSNFIKECNLLLNASNFEKLIKVFKENNANEDSTVRLKVRNILHNNNKLLRMFDNIYN